MKTIKLLLTFILVGGLFGACTADVYIDDHTEEDFSLENLLYSHELWYVDINETEGNGEVPFLQVAFTLTFDNGTLLANNNLVGFGSTGDGFGISIGYYDTYNSTLQIDHDLDGVMNLEVIQHGYDKIELYHKNSNTSYFLNGYMKNEFDYNAVFYDNIEYFLQEYEAWEKTYTSNYGALNDFDDENFLSFIPASDTSLFLSSIDKQGTAVNSIYWDYEGFYEVYDVSGDRYLKTLTLDYDFLYNDYFELTVIDDRTIELFHPKSGTVYEFKGRGFVQYLKGEDLKADSLRKRFKISNPEMNIERMSSVKDITIEVN
ncbi:hypothetical protein SAMN04487906_0203 [Zhouia amylolytica]|uniref:Nicotinic acid mononucleotide adenyltransferase n=1 Tax=Zhouia amylolytica TaxID=376730 RepID=A0A1I6PAY0_9FLAO|nr:nicotinic acid mononucleotide adenyltransferase [Zhouia amylolytica]SFS37295.1 hypothetical protein SAMN04487906_0203 [Zhouia amylolytica]